MEAQIRSRNPHSTEPPAVSLQAAQSHGYQPGSILAHKDNDSYTFWVKCL